MAKYASKVVEQAKKWIGRNEYDRTHRAIIDIYNTLKTLPRGYKVKYTDSWCATFVSAVFINLGYQGLIGIECSCEKMIALCKEKGIYIENENRTPKAGDIIFYDWQDNGIGDNKGWSDHVGIVEKVSGNTITVIEGNYDNSVKRRNIAVNGKNIRGYAAPKYDTEPNYETVHDWQLAAIADGFKFPKYGADGEWGSECEGVAEKAICKKRDTYKYRNLTKIVQKAVGSKIDGKFGDKTEAAVLVFQAKNGLKQDGCVGLKTWKKILKV